MSSQGMPRSNEPRLDDIKRSIRGTNRQQEREQQQGRGGRKEQPARQHKKFPHEETPQEATEQLGETSDEYRPTAERNLRTEMTEGQDLGMSDPEIVTEAPSGMDVDVPPSTPGGFGSQRERRD